MKLTLARFPHVIPDDLWQERGRFAKECPQIPLTFDSAGDRLYGLAFSVAPPRPAAGVPTDRVGTVST
ncbi:hypothetical protein [Corynebacterium sp. LK2510]|uniref:hypothetical protein n=1 Tax=Corynebacterium sp. LK2510 TaxID=3110472 RepID=UPI0034CD9A40